MFYEYVWCQAVTVLGFGRGEAALKSGINLFDILHPCGLPCPNPQITRPKIATDGKDGEELYMASTQFRQKLITLQFLKE